jgi:hypothetical protein
MVAEQENSALAKQSFIEALGRRRAAEPLSS